MATKKKSAKRVAGKRRKSGKKTAPRAARRPRKAAARRRGAAPKKTARRAAAARKKAPKKTGAARKSSSAKKAAPAKGAVTTFPAGSPAGEVYGEESWREEELSAGELDREVPEIEELEAGLDKPEITGEAEEDPEW